VQGEGIFLLCCWMKQVALVLLRTLHPGFFLGHEDMQVIRDEFEMEPKRK
jgi:hypothetical protein